MASLIDLLLYKKEVEIINPINKKPIKKVWVRVLGDFDLNKAYKASRVASNKKRLALRDSTSEDYQDEVMGVADLTREEKEDLVRTARMSIFVSEAQVAVKRPDLPELEEVAVDPDAASLEELENLDKTENKVEDEYQKKLQEYVTDKVNELNAELKEMSDEKLLEVASFEISNVVPFSVFVSELNDQKIFYGTFKDKYCKDREFDNLMDVKNLPREIKDILVETISNLEIGYDEIKN